jgi:hypothetical protein
MTVSTEAVLSDAPAPGRRTISVSFMARRNGGGDVLVYLLNVHVRPQPMVVDQVFFFTLFFSLCTCVLNSWLTTRSSASRTGRMTF